MRRRNFITLIGSAAAWPLAARAQQPTEPVIGFLSARSLDDSANLVAAFRGGLQETGYIEGRNVTIEFRWAEGQYDRLPGLAAELTARRVAAIVAPAMAPVRAAKAATATIPIVFLTGADPVQFGLIQSLSRPGGNVTGVAILTNTLVQKQLELLHEVVSSVTLVALLVNPKNPITESDTKDVQSAAGSTRQQILVLNVSNESDLKNAFTAITERRAGAVLVQSDPFLNSRSDQIAALAAQHRVPAVSPFREFVRAGGLMSYGTDVVDAYRQLGLYVGKILKGAKPSELPVQQAVKVEFAINLRTARTLGLTIPLPLSGRADEVLGCAAAAWPLAARAQQPNQMRRVAVLQTLAENDLEGQSWVNALKQGLAVLGWTDGLIRLDVRWAGGEANLIQRFAKELVDPVCGNSRNLHVFSRFKRTLAARSGPGRDRRLRDELQSRERPRLRDRAQLSDRYARVRP